MPFFSPLPWLLAGAAWGLPTDSHEEATAPPNSVDSEPESPDAAPPPEVDLAAIEAALATDAAATEPDPLPHAHLAPGARATNLNPDLSFIADFALAAFSGEPRQLGAHDPLVNGFNLQQLELSASKPVDPYFRFDANLVFSELGVEIEEVYGTTLAMPGRMQLRVGQMLTRFGRINATHPHTWDFADQSLPIGRVFGAEGHRGLGLEASWLAPLPWYTEVLVCQTMNGGEATHRSWADFSSMEVTSPVDLQTVAAVKQFYPLGPDWSVLWGLSWAVGPNGTGRTNRSEVYGTDLTVKFRPIQRASAGTQVALASELMYRRRQVPDDVVSDLNTVTALTWRTSKRFAMGGRHELGTPELVEGGALADTVALDPDWTSTRHRVAAALTYWPTEFSRLRLQSGPDVAAWIEPLGWSTFLAFELSAGAHGAHAF